MRLISIFAVIILCVGCEQQSNRLYKLDDIASPHIFKPGDRTQFGMSIVSTAQPTYDTAIIEWQTPANPLTLPDGSNIDLLVENNSAALDGLENAFAIRYVAQASDGGKWLYAFSSGDYIYWLYNEIKNEYGIPYWPVDFENWTTEQAYSTILRRCSLSALTECSHAGSMSVTIGYGGVQVVKTPLARFESRIVDYFVTLSIPDIGGVPSQYYETIWYYPGAGEIRFLLSVPGVNSKQYLAEAISTTIRLPAVPSE